MTLNQQDIPPQRIGQNGGNGNNLFFQNENKHILWDLLSASQHFDGLEKDQFTQTLQTFENTMTEVHNANRNQDIIGLNKLFLLKFKDRISNQHRNQSPPGLDAHVRSNTKTGATIKSQYTGEIERHAQEKKDEMLQMLHPKAPATIDFTTQEPYNIELRTRPSTVNYNTTTPHSTSTPPLETIDEETINAALQNKIKAREKELSTYYTNHPPNTPGDTSTRNAPGQKSKTLSLLESTVSDNVHSRFENDRPSADAPTTRRLTIQHPISNDALSDALTLVQPNSDNTDNNENKHNNMRPRMNTRVVHFETEDNSKSQHANQNNRQANERENELQQTFITRLDTIIQQQGRTNELLHREIEIMSQLVNKID